ncbi:hypothetical protein [Paenimyroides aestuarii]|uniref:LAGLIDADG homing endonuclease n=1 Tax=Paenimyroides aestuarii TaxID=2968490 RepID=A0ABY5NU12_9FLAO|nr:hypothetical protein [Paenimyroides aestuarii]UUV22075.1 hypothetical protein NPX36_03250 [Paenimyroides aestuarii]
MHLKLESTIQKTFELPLTEEEINVIKDLYISKNSFGISQNKYQQIINSNILSIDFNEKDSIKMNFTEILSAVIDGAPFTFHLRTKSNELSFESNLGGIPKPDEFHKYLIFYLIYNNEMQFGKKSNKSLKAYFNSETMIKSAMWYLSKLN